tara:strand:- start:61 stop:189 length:129 start_codon:yes stop_codon:yes gene_type:complete
MEVEAPQFDDEGFSTPEFGGKASRLCLRVRALDGRDSSGEGF